LAIGFPRERARGRPDHPYVEVDGKPYDKLEKKFAFHEDDVGSAPVTAAR